MAKKTRKKSAAKSKTRSKKKSKKKTKTRKKAKAMTKRNTRKAKRRTFGDRVSGAYRTMVDTVKGTDRLRNKMEPPGTSETE